MNDLFKLLKFKDKSNCWLCNSFTEIDSDQPDYFFCLCRGCFNFNIEEYLKEKFKCIERDKKIDDIIN
jgi:hypothetical protein